MSSTGTHFCGLFIIKLSRIRRRKKVSTPKGHSTSANPTSAPLHTPLRQKLNNARCQRLGKNFREKDTAGSSTAITKLVATSFRKTEPCSVRTTRFQSHGHSDLHAHSHAPLRRRYSNASDKAPADVEIIKGPRLLRRDARSSRRSSKQTTSRARLAARYVKRSRLASPPLVKRRLGQTWRDACKVRTS